MFLWRMEGKELFHNDDNADYFYEHWQKIQQTNWCPLS